MNYEELLESRNGSAMAKESMPFGQLYKKMVDGKYGNVIDLKEELLDSLVFSDALATESEVNKKLIQKSQLHFTLATDSGGLYGVNVEQGSFRTFARMLEDNPAIVAGKGYIISTIKDILDHASYLHDQGIFHICYSPDNVLARKGDNAAMLLFHGSAYQAMNDQESLYGSSVAFVAPEVLEEGIFDARADIYSIGKFMEYLYSQAEIPFELKGVIKKATNTDPDKRYQTPEEMKSAITKRMSARTSIVTFLAALILAAVAFGAYFSLMPERENIEFVKPAPKAAAEDDLLDDGFDPTMELGLPTDTTVGKVDEKKMKEYQAKAEQIFRKRFTTEAEGILSRIYNDDKMRTSAKNFSAGNESTMRELMKAQEKYGSEAGLNNSRSQLIASQIIEQLTNKMKAKMSEKEKSSTDEE